MAEEIIQKTIESLDIQTEVLTLERIQETIKTTEQSRQSKIDGLKTANDDLNKTISRLNNELLLLNSVNDYNSEIILNLTTFKDKSQPETLKNENIFKLLNRKGIELDNLKVTIAKNLNDLDSTINSLRSSTNSLTDDLRETREKLANLVSRPVNGEQDSTILKINLYRNLGVRVENFDGNDEVVIQDKKSSESSVLRVGDYGDYFVTNYVWDRLG